MSDPTPRRIPGPKAVCRSCRGEIRWARTLATPKGPGGNHMPLDPVENPDGNVAARPTMAGALVCRVLSNDDSLDTTTEYRAMPHFATCTARPDNAAKAAIGEVVAGFEELLGKSVNEEVASS